MKIDRNDVYELRMLVFVEVEPQSNLYNHVLLNPEQYKKISDAIYEVTSQDGDRQVGKLETSVEVYPMPDLKAIDEENI